MDFGIVMAYQRPTPQMSDHRRTPTHRRLTITIVTSLQAPMAQYWEKDSGVAVVVPDISGGLG